MSLKQVSVSDVCTYLVLYFNIRVVAMGSEKTIGPHRFVNWGSHSNDYPCAYFTAAAAIGMTREEIDTYIKKLDKVFTKFKQSKATNKT